VTRRVGSRAVGGRRGPGDPRRPASASRTSRPATPRCGTWSGCSCGTGGLWQQPSPRRSRPVAGSRGTVPTGPKPAAMTSWPGASAAPAAPSSVLAGTWRRQRPPTRLEAAPRHKEAPPGVAGGQALPGRSPKPELWACGGPRCGSSPPASASTRRRSGRRTSGTLPPSMRWTRPWRAPTPPTAAGRTARRQDPAAPTRAGTGTPGLAGTGPPVPPRSWRRGSGGGRAGMGARPFTPRCQAEPAARKMGTLGGIRGFVRGWEAPLIPCSGPVSPRTPPRRGGRLAPKSRALPSPLPLPPKRPAPRCLAGKPSAPAAAAGHQAREPRARSPRVGALGPPSPGAQGSDGVPAAPAGSRGAPSVPCPPTTATTPGGRTPRGQAEVRDPRVVG